MTLALVADLDPPLLEDSATRTLVEPDDTDYLHLVFEGRIEALITRLLRRAPRTLCGESLWGDPDRPEPSPCSPYCPACVKVSGLTEGEIAARTEYVPSYWV